MHDCFLLVESFDWLIPFLCVKREMKMKRDRDEEREMKMKRDRDEERQMRRDKHEKRYE